MKRAGAFSLFLAVFFALGCLEHPKDPPIRREKSLFTRLGGEATTSLIVEDFSNQVLTADSLSDTIKQAFSGAAGPTTKRKLTERLGYELGGVYEGKQHTLLKALHSLGEKQTPDEQQQLKTLLRSAVLAALPRNSDVNFQKDLEKTIDNVLSPATPTGGI